ncbi:hypothetical protein S40285_01182 [Stachybotrys chlorohalonatus IBT 40285]|uniref:CENP-V/GFA domain-containing protein n=1 Tax=Stachybotrys chlorohalonatus (strain IBT 40285) TaxID=1283841 RepID=A0A084QXW4_STAC4|nr:hypothetical protein S40285_01182 [Stachybotrys chlorohalonata IBT 40285]
MEVTPQSLRGGCQCGRNRYIITIPQGRTQDALVLFNTDSHHQIPLGTPLAAYIRVPLSWYHSTTQAFFPDETHATIRRVYTHPSQQHAKRHFCGYCGTPLSYWSEKPRTEADFINLTLGSLLREDLEDLEDMGLVREEGELGRSPVTTGTRSHDATLQPSGVAWFDRMVEGSRLDKLRRVRTNPQEANAQVEIDWEIVEFPDLDDGTRDPETSIGTPTKRKMQDRDDSDINIM